MTVEYACTYGISSPVPGLKIGEHVTSLHDGLCIQSFPGKDGRVYWFIMEKLDRKYSYSEAPRYSSEDAANRCGQLKERKIWKDVKFGELWDKREVVSKTALEENVFQTWNFGPVVCIGDSMHKMAPNTGQGANCAIEDAACLLNLLKECYLEGCLRKPSRCELDTRLQQFTKMRVERITQVYKAARLLVRIHARDGLHMKLLGRYVIPYAGDVSADKASETVVGAPVLSFISPPKRCGPGWTSFQTRGLITMPIRGTAMILSLLVVGMTLYTLRVW
ncbi:hypothetical protein EYZ11_010341 [Aspergillus tanneri]|uniref:FAD-binding domain-containing protein n=1 Tax=Aspergillus tanneri TaxID=1220188 RepID=A0A4S3J7R7_9EURO|nr:hypothetical protein EYZ11_010341 [Aspergillus tanneri]